MKKGIELIAEERKRQIEVEGFTAEHDKELICGELTDAAVCYAIRGYYRTRYDSFLKTVWPWNIEWWKPSQDNRIKELSKAGALIAAEIDRLQLASGVLPEEIDKAKDVEGKLLESAAEKYAMEYVKGKFADIYSMPAKIAFSAVKKDFISGAEWCNEQREFALIEYTTEKQMEIISEFMQHYKAQTGKTVPEKILLSFFNA